MVTERKIKVLVTKVGLDGHDRGAKVVSSLLKEAGMEVIYLGMFQRPESIVRAAIDEDVDVIGLSYLSGEHLIFTPKIVDEMKKNGIDDVLLIAGGTFPPEDIPIMEEMGIDKVFRAGSLTESIVDYINNHVERTGNEKETEHQ
ncbi:MAG: cobalamin B12-binding domain-containing protein [Deltaproteobacteria bacterium]|nr:cobalamin B12-binding domain-containing protein [Deltaproteobacteria bacterium]MBW2110762.1 cobalamin B12-binding domain-containing protein [Deltaproteobacteria bacterium]MBW2354151.1 cobalamin B12-binding domain-containing protein [Deltaproteobacteria bacterium]HDZ90663.1 cobalamin B12-binding domain-containing protein [Deltaproteobacteria bacterium]